MRAESWSLFGVCGCMWGDFSVNARMSVCLLILAYICIMILRIVLFIFVSTICNPDRHSRFRPLTFCGYEV